MREGKKINGYTLNNIEPLSVLFSKENIFGFSKQLKLIVEKRLETKTVNSVSSLKFSKTIGFYNLIFDVFPENNNFKNYFILNVFMLDIINSYRGFRHSVGLPTRGQRTWSNAWSVYRSNLTLRQFKIHFAKRIHTTINLSELNIAYLAEQINNLWRLQWDYEWRFSRKQRQGKTKKSKSFFNVDLKALASGSVGGKKNKKNYLVGFDPGFTKYVFKQSLRKTHFFKKK